MPRRSHDAAVTRGLEGLGGRWAAGAARQSRCPTGEGTVAPVESVIWRGGGTWAGGPEGGARWENGVGIAGESEITDRLKTGNKGNVVKNGLMKIFERVVPSGTATSPLHDNNEVRICCCDVDHLADAVNGTGLECDMTDPNRLETTDYLGSLGDWDASCYTESLDREPLTAHILQWWDQEGELTRIDVKRVEGQTDARGNLPLDFRNLARCR